LSVEEFYEHVDKWIVDNGFQKDLKRKTEEVTSKGKKIEWVIEIWKNPVRAIKQVVRLRALLNNVKELKIKKKGHTIRMNQADILIVIDGFVETSLTSRWTQKPLYQFFRTLFDKFIWNIGQNVTEANEGPVTEYSYDLHKMIKAFFNSYKTKVA